MHPKSLIAAFALGSLSLACAPTLTAQAVPEAPELAQLRKQHAAKALSAARNLADQFTKALATLEKEYGTAGEYEQALAAQKRRMELADLYSQQLEDPTFSNAIVLKPSDARLNGSVTYDRTQNALVGWKTSGSIANWDVIRLVPGTYEISIRYGVADYADSSGRYNSYQDSVTGGEFEFYEDSSLFGAAANRRTAQVTSTGGWTTIVPLELPPFQLDRTVARFALRITKPRGSGGVMLLKEIRLTPTLANKQPAPAPVASAVTAKQEYANLRTAHAEIVKQAALPILTTYSSQLTELVARATAGKESEVGEDLQAEQHRLQRILDNLTPAQLGKFMASDKKLLNRGNEEWQEVKYVADPTNTGDRFMVSHQEQTMQVRLIGITCPPYAKEITPKLEAYAKYFDITPEDVALLAIQARDFTSTFLSGKKLRLLSRGVKNKDGVVPVTVLIEEIGDFAGVLVDNGLAAIDPPRPKGKSARRGEDALFNALQEREAAAKARTVPLGAWAMKLEATPTAAAK